MILSQPKPKSLHKNFWRLFWSQNLEKESIKTLHIFFDFNVIQKYMEISQFCLLLKYQIFLIIKFNMDSTYQQSAPLLKAHKKTPLKFIELPFYTNHTSNKIHAMYPYIQQKASNNN